MLKEHFISFSFQYDILSLDHELSSIRLSGSPVKDGLNSIRGRLHLVEEFSIVYPRLITCFQRSINGKSSYLYLVGISQVNSFIVPVSITASSCGYKFEVLTMCNNFISLVVMSSTTITFSVSCHRFGLVFGGSKKVVLQGRSTTCSYAL